MAAFSGGGPAVSPSAVSPTAGQGPCRSEDRWGDGHLSRTRGAPGDPLRRARLHVAIRK